MKEVIWLVRHARCPSSLSPTAIPVAPVTIWRLVSRGPTLLIPSQFQAGDPNSPCWKVVMVGCLASTRIRRYPSPRPARGKWGNQGERGEHGDKRGERGNRQQIRMGNVEKSSTVGAKLEKGEKMGLKWEKNGTKYPFCTAPFSPLSGGRRPSPQFPLFVYKIWYPSIWWKNGGEIKVPCKHKYVKNTNILRKKKQLIFSKIFVFATK